PSAMILDEHSFQHFLDERRIIFCGNGSIKWQAVCRHPHAVFSPHSYTMQDMATVSSLKYDTQNFTSIAYSEPSYLKNVYTGIKDA
ncbi:MAG: tRNA (adenosine(37)-N6)-threonylcarbamoyltransferase complex dimerization subunit type 1 TsaB, partial [Chitinophagaceae bacterium]|nr:tRNA (adenosine(37)-N6)-threonylcarbamoyltransferase complex dimerization subunit type 1 TsaB [Chitinophagaceae bacterium]